MSRSQLTYSLLQKMLVVIMLLLASNLFGQNIGDKDRPLQFSIHTYEVTMGNFSYPYTWNIYNNDATERGIEDGIDLPLTKGTAYTQNSIGKTFATNTSYFEVVFDGTMTALDTFYVVYREEEPSQGCYSYRFFEIILQPQFDVDAGVYHVEDQTPRCADVSDVMFTSVGATITDTVSFTVQLMNNDYETEGGLGTWGFNYEVDIVGANGNNGTITQVEVFVGGSLEDTWNPGTSNYSRTKSVATTNKNVVVKVTMQHNWGETQDIDFNLTLIEGSNQEQDADVITPNPDDNRASIQILSVPDAGAISALN